MSVAESEPQAPPVLLVERLSAAIAIFRINRPEARNALNQAVRHALATAFRKAAAESDLRCIILAGNESSFAAGADIREMVDTSAVDLHLRHNERLWGAIADCPVPVIAAVNGFALGGGMELAMHADIIIAGRSAKFGQPEVRLGIMPGAGGTQRLARVVGKFVAMRLCLTGAIISAQEAQAIGLVSLLVDDDAVMPVAMETAQELARLAPIAVAQIKEIILQGADMPLGAALTLERKGLQVLFATKDKHEGMSAFLEKRQPTFLGA
ncbi:enoyl-CoA hydratase-related protein [Aminobacter carboxidus]|uniref:Enoyl-CoA hydratase/isomerase family protein n=1 Tax=Aminobacter carboxidus TaxID=376165 RepID=A0ABR9GRT1_9HYPH|nr:enoyl-CoA hydratase-related protein [Aminobacter carboxidus]MBE1206269.1 enoyl-CoA hydratase/isomerase family protein [Aminobacter carboxidus]